MTQAVSDEVERVAREALSVVALAAAQLRDLSYRDLANETRDAHNVLANALAAMHPKPSGEVTEAMRTSIRAEWPYTPNPTDEQIDTLLFAMRPHDPDVKALVEAPRTAAELCAVIRAWLDADDATHWGDFEKQLDALAPFKDRGVTR